MKVAGGHRFRAKTQPTLHFFVNAKEINPLQALHFEEAGLLHLAKHLRTQRG
jgi:hypothetical protein